MVVSEYWGQGEPSLVRAARVQACSLRAPGTF